MAPLCPWCAHHTQGRRWRRANTGCVHPPSNFPWTRPATPLERSVDTAIPTKCRISDEYSSNPSCNSLRWGPDGAGSPRDGATLIMPLVLLLANLLARTLASQRSLNAFLFTGFQVKGVALDLFDNVFLLHLALEAP